MISVNEQNYLAKRVYRTDLKNHGKDSKPKVNSIESSPDKSMYKILDISHDGRYGSHNQYGVENGMQAMAVAPVKNRAWIRGLK